MKVLNGKENGLRRLGLIGGIVAIAVMACSQTNPESYRPKDSPSIDCLVSGQRSNVSVRNVNVSGEYYVNQWFSLGVDINSDVPKMKILPKRNDNQDFSYRAQLPFFPEGALMGLQIDRANLRTSDEWRVNYEMALFDFSTEKEASDLRLYVRATCVGVDDRAGKPDPIVIYR